MQRVYVDFNTMNQDLWSEERRVWIHERHTKPTFKSGMIVIVYDEEMEVQAELEYDDVRQVWWARPNWSTRRYLTE